MQTALLPGFFLMILLWLPCCWLEDRDKEGEQLKSRKIKGGEEILLMVTSCTQNFNTNMTHLTAQQ